MSEADTYREVVDTLNGLKKEMAHLQRDVHEIMSVLGDATLSDDEHKILRESIRKAKARDLSDFTSWSEAKKELK